MVRTLKTCIAFLLIAGSVFADKPFSDLGGMKQAVRWKVRIWDTRLLPDSTLTGFCQEALITTATECRGIESRFRIITTAGQTFYAIPDTVVEIVFASAVNNRHTKSIKAFYPQFFEDAFSLTQLDGGENDDSPDAIPQGYKYWRDSLQLLPTPIKTDTIYFDCYVEHPLIVSDTDDVRLRGNYNDAALYQACENVYESLEMWDAADKMDVKYEKKKKELLSIYQRKLEILQGKQ